MSYPCMEEEGLKYEEVYPTESKYSHECHCDVCLKPPRTPSPDRLSTRNFAYDKIVLPEQEIPYSEMFPSEVVMNMQRIRTKKLYEHVAKDMVQSMRQVNLKNKHNDRHDEFRERMRRKLEAKNMLHLIKWSSVLRNIILMLLTCLHMYLVQIVRNSLVVIVNLKQVEHGATMVLLQLDP